MHLLVQHRTHGGYYFYTMASQFSFHPGLVLLKTAAPNNIPSSLKPRSHGWLSLLLLAVVVCLDFHSTLTFNACVLPEIDESF
jgi:hypothetical protein